MITLSHNTIFLATALLLGLGSANLEAKGQKTPIQYVCDSIKTYDANGKFKSLKTYKYNKSGQVLQYRYFSNKKDTLQLSNFTDYTYDEQGHLLTRKSELTNEKISWQVSAQYKNDSIVKLDSIFLSRGKHKKRIICTWVYNDKMQLKKETTEIFDDHLQSSDYENYHAFREILYNEKRNPIYDSFINLNHPDKYGTKTEYAYDKQNHKIEETTYHRDSGEWVPYQSAKNQYNRRGYLIAYNFYHWRNGVWLHVIKETSRYSWIGRRVSKNNAKRKDISYTEEIAYCIDGCHFNLEYVVPDTINDSTPWEETNYNYKRERHKKKTLPDDDIKYDKHGNILQEIFYRLQDTKQDLYSKKEYTYDSLGHCTCCTQYNRNSDQWVESHRSEFEYDENGNNICETKYLGVFQQGWIKISTVKKHWTKI